MYRVNRKLGYKSWIWLRAIRSNLDQAKVSWEKFKKGVQVTRGLRL